jgi:hypothetical protein
VMVASTGAMICSGMLSLGRWLFGYVEKNKYYPGRFSILKHLR